jgi:hypothetical protein
LTSTSQSLIFFLTGKRANGQRAQPYSQLKIRSRLLGF